MEGLQRSAVSFRRQGSSGTIWDDKFLSEVMTQAQIQADADKKEAAAEADKIQPPGAEEKVKDEIKPSAAVGSIDTIQRSRSNGGNRGFRTVKVSPEIEPPSPKFSSCGFCTAFGKAKAEKAKAEKARGGCRKSGKQQRRS